MHKTIIIGAGPAGLATAHSLSLANKNDFILIERGRSLVDRRRELSDDIGTGVGGAGLYSDGKFSFFPSASWLWKNLNYENIQKAYQWLQNTLATYNVFPPAIESHNEAANILNNKFKAYPSYYIGLDNRYQMIDQWSKDFSNNIHTHTIATNIIQKDGFYEVHTNNNILTAKNIVIATGRMGPLQLNGYSLEIEKSFQRIEIGVRIKGPHEHPFFTELQQHGYLDPKFILTHPDHPLVSWRTFCFCKRGEIMNSSYEDFVALSGRADCAMTNESNVGFNTRIKIPELKNDLPKLSTPFVLNLQKVYENKELLKEYFTAAVAEYIFLGLNELRNHFHSLNDASAIEITGPTLEGIGDYPIVNTELKTKHPGIYIAGDSLGLFRGLTAALLSGHYIGQHINQHE